MQNHEYQKAHNFFPRGLTQPQDSFRFSIDALLLSCFLSLHGNGAKQLIADIGTGCGVVAFGMLLRFPKGKALGIDKEPELLLAAKQNAQLLGFADNFVAHEQTLDTQQLLDRPEKHIYAQTANTNLPRNFAGNCDIVLANPPYRILGTGRLPKSSLRQAALFGTQDTLKAFCMAGKLLMAENGSFGVIYPASQKQILVNAFTANDLHIASMLTILPQVGKEASLLLVEGKNQRSPLREHSLVLYGESNAFTQEALEFCPFLSCNNKCLEKENN